MGLDQNAQRLGMVLVGLGRSGHFHLTSIKSAPKTSQLLWVVDVNVELCKTIAEEMGCKWSTSLDEPLKDPCVQAVVIASATDTHFPFIMQSLRARKSVLAEKPISHNVSEVQQAVDLAKNENLPLLAGFQRRHDANFVELKRQMDIGAIGKLKMIKSCSRDNPVPPLEYLATSGGIFQDMLIHDFDMHDLLTDGQTPESIHAVGHCYHSEIAKMDDIDIVGLITKYSSGIIGMIDTCRDASYGYDQRVEAFGAEGMITAKNELKSTVEVACSKGHTMPPAAWSFPERYKAAYLEEFMYFLNLVLAGPDSEIHKKEQIDMMRHPRLVRTALAAELSWRLNRAINLSEDLDQLMAPFHSHQNGNP